KLIGAPTASFSAIPVYHSAQCLYFIRVADTLQLYQFGIAAHRENTCRIQNISNPGRHASAKVLPCFTKYHDHPVRHVFASVSAYTFYNGKRPTIPHSKSLSRTASS